MEMTYLKNGETLGINEAACTGCGDCIEVCPHGVLGLARGKISVMRRSSCMECGACMRNCPHGAIRVTAGVGCAAAVIQGKLKGSAPECGCSCGGDDQQ